MDHQKNNHMKKKSGGKVVLLGISLFAAGFAISCNSDETSETTTTTDTTSIMKMDTTTPVVTDTNTGRTTDATIQSSSTQSSATMGKPNPAKKGKKGKVTVVASSTSSDASVEVVPAFQGGSAALQEYFNKNLTYPVDASNEGVEGTVQVTFMVDEKGNLTDVQPVGEKLGYGLEEEAVRVIKKMPDWTPGKLKGENVKTKFMLPVRFELE
jgi:periplasmic protein TonB